ncbi:hypothetical protein JCM31447_25440 [Fluviispira sanaruensis]|uniref:Methyltransferase n=2 Tax=Fluviispira sanaruensis TaxID=2493639 RepID=A0A4V0P2Q9_FLUSA|nr:hypothetical protein JCM31447_25440 [Fluviispira sanaruensis]
MFHVFEHLKNPIEILASIYEKLKINSYLIIEVPHARDALISWFDIDEFKKFSFWSEHLILHTRESLRIIVESIGLNVISIEGIQRYPLSNHLYWLTNKKPGGHLLWNQFSSKTLNSEYENILSKLDITDSLILVAKKI